MYWNNQGLIKLKKKKNRLTSAESYLHEHTPPSVTLLLINMVSKAQVMSIYHNPSRS